MFVGFVALVVAHILNFRNTMDVLFLLQLLVFCEDQSPKVFFLLLQKLSGKQQLPNYTHALHSPRA
jgi:hypothetical protein